jgi:hypothetical protein
MPKGSVSQGFLTTKMRGLKFTGFQEYIERQIFSLISAGFPVLKVLIAYNCGTSREHGCKGSFERCYHFRVLHGLYCRRRYSDLGIFKSVQTTSSDIVGDMV